ncbi:hypothetical protein TSAR_007225 [Trichomalopsis sarcophagae]|uniref:Uncharacterized protein n=1 Tax=Trichomalopsis sarcophagae TaxID=543379 RepID=A0A232ETG2_9HYME|nr:hypothetical protein TSAR_007225 [Trichomalopsis sarcophagae]
MFNPYCLGPQNRPPLHAVHTHMMSPPTNATTTSSNVSTSPNLWTNAFVNQVPTPVGLPPTSNQGLRQQLQQKQQYRSSTGASSSSWASRENVEAATKEINEDLLDEVFMGFVFDVHRMTKTGSSDVTDSEEVVRNKIVVPAVQNIISEYSLQNDPQGLKGTYQKLENVLDSTLKELLDLTLNPDRISVKGVNFIVNSYWPEVQQRIEDHHRYILEIVPSNALEIPGMVLYVFETAWPVVTVNETSHSSELENPQRLQFFVGLYTDIEKTIYKNESPKGFFRGLLPTLLHIAPDAGLQFGTYEPVKDIKFLPANNEDSHHHNKEAAGDGDDPMLTGLLLSNAHASVLPGRAATDIVPSYVSKAG